MKKKILFKALCLFTMLSINLKSQAQCGPGQSELTLSIDFSSDGFPDEDGWRLINLTDGVTVDSACFGTYASSSGIETITICADTGKMYALYAYDDFGDGLDGSVYDLSYSYGGNIATIGSQNYNIPASLCGAAYSNNELADSSSAFSLAFVAPPSCLDPTANANADVSSTTATVSWVEDGSAVQWEVEYDTTGFTLGTGMSVIVNTDTFTTITGLMSNTDYDWYVRAICSPGDTSAWSASESFTTLCSSFTPPYSEDFSSYLPDCWSEAKGQLTTNTVFTSASSDWLADGFLNNGSTGSARMNIFSTNRFEWLISPSIDLGTAPNNYRVKFDVGLTDYTGSGNDMMGPDDTLSVVISTDNGATWSSANVVKLYDANSQPSNSGETVFIDLSPYTGTIKVGFYATSTVSNTDYNVYIDNFVAELTPSCPVPSSTSTTSTGSDSAVVSWLENGSATQWEVEYDTTGFAPGTGMSVIVNTNTFTTLSALTPETDYDWYVRAICGPGDTSAWSVVESFTTNCVAISTFPYTETFEGLSDGDIPNCWDNREIVGTTNWLAQDGSGGDITAAHNGTVWFEKNYLSSEALAISPAFDLTAQGGSDSRINVWLHRHASADANDQYVVMVNTVDSINGADTLLDLFSITTAAPAVPATGWYNYLINIPSSYNASSNVYILIKGNTSAGFSSYDLGVDDFTIEAIPACLAPTANSATSITDTSATLSWMENGTATEWEVEYDTAGFTLGTGRNTVQVLTDTFTTITGLMARTDYDWYVRSVCGAGDTSAWTTVESFTTTATPITLPYSQNFEGMNPLSDFTTSSGSDASLALDAGSNCAGTNSLFMTGGSSSGWSGGSGMTGTSPTQAWVTNSTKISSATLTVDATAVTDGIELFFDLKQEWSYGPGYSWARILVNGNQLSPDYQPSTQNSDPCATNFIDLSAFAGTNFDVTFQFSGKYDDARGSSGQGDNAYFDNINFVLVSCPDPSNLSASSITNTSADLSWTENGSATSWVVEYGEVGFTPGSAGATQVVASNDTVNVTGLSPFTSYDFYVQADCGMMDSSRNIGPFTFTAGSPLAGTYTIDSTLGTTSTSFESFSVFGNAINNFGVSGAVTVNVAAGTYNDQLSLGEIVGASNLNNITINGNNAATISHDQSVRNSTITLEGTSWTTIQNMTIAATGGTDSWGIQLMDSAHHITIDSNNIILPIGTTADVAGIISSATEDSDVADGNNAYDVTISNNTITGGENGMSMRGDFSSTNRNANITIMNNVMTDNDDMGIYIAGWDNVTIDGNTVNTPNNSGSDAFYSSDLENFTINANYFNGNDYGMDMDDSNFDNTVATNSTISNNMVIGGDDAIAMDDVENVNIFHNTFYAEDWAMQLNDDANLDIRNNIFYSVDDHALNSDDGVVHTMDNNIFYTGGTADLVEFGTSDYADLAAFQAGEPTMNVNSLQGDPLFVANGIDLHVQGTLANDVGDNSVGITTDFDGDMRPLAPSTTVDIGADEFTPATCLAPVPNMAMAISSNSALASWTESGSATQWQVEWDTTGYMVGTSMNSMIVNTDTFFTITGLMAQTTYDYYVRAICAAGDTSDWSVVSTFTTACNSLTAPYSINFDLAVAGDFNSAGIPCWQAVGAGANDADIVTSTDHAAATIPSAPNVVEFNDGTWPADPSIVVSPPFSDLSTGLNRINMQVAFESATATDVSLYVGVMTDPSDLSTFTILDTVDATDFSGNLDFNRYSFDFTNTAAIGSAQYIAIAHGPGIFEAYMDNFVYEAIPVCAVPDMLMTTEITDSSASFTWVDTNITMAPEYQYSYGLSGFTAGNGTQVVTTSDSVNVTGLMDSTDYDWYVRSICGPMDSSAWAGPVSFRTDTTNTLMQTPYYPVGVLNTEDATTGVADSIGVTAFTSGTVVGIDLRGGNGLQFTIIDQSTGSQEGINVFSFNDVSSYVVNEGDSVLVRGDISQFNGLTQIEPDSISIISTGNALPTPEVVAALDESTESKWLSIPTNFVVLNTSGAGSSNVNITNGTDTLVMRIDSDTDINDTLNARAMPLIPGDTICGLFGVGGQFDSSNPYTDGYQIFPMRWSDLTVCRLAIGIDNVENNNNFTLYPNPTNGEFVIETSGFNNPTVQIAIRDMNGRLISNESVNNASNAFRKSFNLTGNAKGVYFISILDGETVINQKLIIH